MLPDTTPRRDDGGTPHDDGGTPHDDGGTPHVDGGGGGDPTGPAGHRVVIARWPDGADTDDALADLYAWPARSDRPVVRANMIASLDGGAAIDGRSAGLGNPMDERLFAILRDLSEVVLVGSGTVRAEMYGGIVLDGTRRARRVRWGLGGDPPPIAVVTARGLDPGLPLFAEIVTPPIVITTATAAHLVPQGVPVIIAGHDRVNLSTAVDALAVAGFRRIHCEGGPGLLGSLAALDLLDECCLTIAPMVLGAGLTPLLPVPLDRPVRWELATAMIGGDHVFTRYRRTTAR